MKLCVYVWFAVLMCMSHWCSAKDIKYFESDTTWIVNYQYSQVERDTFDFKLSLPELPDSLADYHYIRIFWGSEKDGNTEYSDLIQRSELPGEWRHKYATGKYFLTIKYYKSAPANVNIAADKEKCCWIFNQDLQGHITVAGKDGCLESGVDTFYVKMADHLGNPPGTRYTVEVRKDFSGKDPWKVAPDPALMKDSAMVIFSGPTGTYGADIRFRMTYRDDNLSVQTRSAVTEWRSVHVYKTPDLKDIFSFRDTLTEGESIDDFKKIEVCTNEELGAIHYDSLINVKYMYVDNLPMYSTRQNFKVDYFFKESADQEKWENVTSDTARVDTVKMIFKEPGFYKIKMVAFNQCGLDSLSTDSIKGHDEKRHIIVFQGGTNVIRCDEDTICGMPAEGRWISFMDLGKRYDWDPVPKYEFLITRPKPGGVEWDTLELESAPEIICYKDGIPFIPTSGEQVGSDSTSLKIKLYETGIYTINLTRTRHCDPPVSCTHMVSIGDVPELPRDTLWNYFGQENGNPYYYCDTLKFVLPEIRIDSNFMQLDSIQWCFQKGSHLDTMYQKYGLDQIYRFDSIGDQRNYMTLSARNFCGWSSVEKAELYTNMVPKVVLWRDSVENNDSLCVGSASKYHWVGDLPEKYKIKASWTEPAVVNGVLVHAGNSTFMAGSNGGLPEVGSVKFNREAEKIYEYFTVSNHANTSCEQIIRDSVVVIEAPDSVLFDTIRYCSNLAVLKTETLFENNPPNLKYIDWKWNQQAASRYDSDHYNPEFALNNPSKTDTLLVRTSSSKGCYLEKRVILQPLELPELVLAHKDVTECADVQIAVDQYTTDYIASTNAGSNTGISLKVFQDKVESAGLLYDTTATIQVKKDLALNHETQDTIRLIYEVANGSVTPGFGDCLERDTVTLKVWKPLLRITGSDTIRDLTMVAFQLAGPQSSVRVDTADIVNGLIEWKVLEGAGSLDHVHELKPSYSFQDADKLLDSLLFELTGYSPCGSVLSDTLVVYLPKEELWADVDTICNNYAEYKLWAPGQTFGKFVHVSSIRWKLLDDKNGVNLGRLEPDMGSEARYIPSFDAWQADTVKIEVEAWNIYDVTHAYPSIKDTVFLKVNRAPENIYPDTLYLQADQEAGRKIIFDHIAVGRNGTFKRDEAYCQLIKWDWIKGEGEGASFYPAGTKNGVYVGTPPSDENYATDMRVILKGFPGCSDQYANVVLLGVLPPKVSLSSFDICDKKSVRIDTGYRIQARDKFTKLEWGNNGNGHFTLDYSAYQAGENDQVNQFTLKVTKEFTLYDNTPGNYTQVATGNVHLYREPDFNLLDGASRNYTHDTLCIGVNNFTYKREWVDGNFDLANYTDQNLIATKSTGLTGDFPDFVLNDGVAEAELIVSTDFGGCKMWENVADTIYITRLKEMIGDFDVPDQLCEGNPVTLTNVRTDPMAQRYSWIAEGGTIDQTNLQHPVYIPTVSGDGSVSLVIVPPHGCTPETKVTKAFHINEKPELLLKDTILCEGSDLLIHFERHAQVKSIAWKVNGRLFATTITATDVNYSYDASDVVGGKMQITAEITPEDPCTDVILSNMMTVTFQKAPQISGSLQGTVCQGDSITLTNDIITVANQEGVLWSLAGSEGMIKEPALLNTKYIPGEISGDQVLQIAVKGLHGCTDVTKQVKINVNKSEFPDIRVPNIKCSGTEITFSHEVEGTRPSGASGEWFVDDVKESDSWYTFKRTFQAAGNYKVRFTTTNNGICPRSVEQYIHINLSPVVDFTSQPDSIAGSGKEIQFVNQTEGTVTYNWDFHGQGTKISDQDGIYVHRYDLTDAPYLFTNVTLTVKNGNSCEGTLTKTIKVVNLPVAHFEVISFDQCTGQVAFKDLSEGENISYHWDLGNGNSSTDTVPLDFAYTPVFRDTVYTIALTVSNEAGEHIHTEKVKMISLLKPKFIISPDKEGCEKRQVAKGFSNRTQGDADLYTFSWGDGSPHGVFDEFYPVPVYHKYNNPEVTMKKFYIELTAANVCYTKVYVDSVLIYPNVINTAYLADQTRICFGNEITFRNESFGFGTDAQAWWSFGDGQNSVVNNDYEVPHRYNQPGTYPVKLIMTDRCNSDTSEITQVYILGDIALDFAMEEKPYCSGQKIEMKVLAEMRDKFTNYHWDFGDGNPVNDEDSVMQKYLYEGDYMVKLSANSVSEGNCPVTTVAKEVQVHKTPWASITPIENLSGCAPYVVDKFLRVGTGEELVYWDFKNGATSTEPEVHEVEFSDPGNYPVTLRLTSQEGCVDTTTKVVVVKETPQPFFTVSDSLFCTSDGNIAIDFINKTSSPELSSFEWSYDGRLPFSRNEQPGTLNLTDRFENIRLTLLATNTTTGCSKEFNRSVVSGKIVKLQVEVDTTLCLEEPIELTNTAAGIDHIVWDLGDGTQETGNTFTYVYDEPGKYHLKVRAGSEEGCKDSLSKNVTVYPLPVADFSFAEERMSLDELKLPEGVDVSKLPDVKNGMIRFMNHSFVDPYPFTTGELNSFWDFGDSSEIILKDAPTHHFPNNGLYEVKLLVKAENGCVDSVSQMVSIDAVKGLFIPNAFAPGAGKEENPGVALFQPKGIGLLSYKIQVYDHWGTCVWSSDKLIDGRPAEGWDGTFKGQPLPKNLYTWKVSAIFIDGTVWEGEKGHTNGMVSLIR